MILDWGRVQCQAHVVIGSTQFLAGCRLGPPFLQHRREEESLLAKQTLLSPMSSSQMGPPTHSPLPFQYSLCNEPLIELSNPGASGSLFYVTSDDEFIIKTVMHKEAEFLQKLLPGYYMVGVMGSCKVPGVGGSVLGFFQLLFASLTLIPLFFSAHAAIPLCPQLLFPKALAGGSPRYFLCLMASPSETSSGSPPTLGAGIAI